MPVPVRVTLILVLIHSEDLTDWGLSPYADGGVSSDLIAAYLSRTEM